MSKTESNHYESSEKEANSCFVAPTRCGTIKNIALSLAGFSATAFFLTATLGIIWAVNLVEVNKPIYEGYWIEGFGNWSDVATNVEDLNDTLNPAVLMTVELFPELVGYMSEMNENVA